MVILQVHIFSSQYYIMKIQQFIIISILVQILIILLIVHIFQIKHFQIIYAGIIQALLQTVISKKSIIILVV